VVSEGSLEGMTFRRIVIPSIFLLRMIFWKTGTTFRISFSAPRSQATETTSQAYPNTQSDCAAAAADRGPPRVSLVRVNRLQIGDVRGGFSAADRPADAFGLGA